MVLSPKQGASTGLMVEHELAFGVHGPVCGAVQSPEKQSKWGMFLRRQIEDLFATDRTKTDGSIN